MKRHHFICSVISLVFSLQLLASSHEQLPENTLSQLASQSTWAKLLAFSKQNQPQITDQHFYLTAQPINLSAELLATLTAFRQAVTKPNDHAICKYPARYQWLKQQLPNYFSDISEPECTEFDEYSRNNTSLSLIFATGYLGNPASYYGHLLLKINTEPHRRLYDHAVNFGADIPNEDGMVTYIVKGLIGGYDSSFTTQGFFYHFQNYGENEFRDLWEYQLALSTEQRKLVIAHLWELMTHDYTYYFLNRNCAYFMADVLDLVIDMPMLTTWQPWVAPQTIVQQIADASNGRLSAVAQTRYFPSRQSRLYQRYATLTDSEQDLVLTLAKQPETIVLSSLQDRSTESAYKVLDTLIDYFQFIRDEHDATDSNNQHYNSTLALRYQLPAGVNPLEFSSQNQPQLGRNLSRTALGSNTATQGQITLNIRPAYYDPLDATYGHVPHSALTMGGIELAFAESELSIQKVDLVNILNLRRNYTMLPGDQDHSWYLQVGASQTNTDCTSCLAPLIQSGIGFARSFLADQFSLGGFVGAGFHSEQITSQGFFASARLISNWYVSEQLSWHAELEHRQYQHHHQFRLNSGIRYQWTPNQDARILMSYDDDSQSAQIGAEMGWYW